ncbi:aa591c71-8f23-4f2c-974f-6e1772b2a613 [Thermothielavioides terrestris]|uniref:Aa591c71-8f23-4f2c-974f-6e1772b2a613 n=1 Tax=Thermothielavioides terrestris TaxID=2587410 RepID=A0A446BW75_9PEZI|nr:aa591c71-8f23-4f2c-974f-6e1772b2a613 [Thermothielavioides terrestris]
MGESFTRGLEEMWQSFIDKQSMLVEDEILRAIEDWLEKWMERRTVMSASIMAGITGDEEGAAQLCNRIPTARDVAGNVAKRLHTRYHFDDVRIVEPEIISISPSPDEGVADSHHSNDQHEDPGREAATGNGAAAQIQRASLTQTQDGVGGLGFPRRGTARHGYDLRSIYELPSSDSERGEGDEDDEGSRAPQTRMRTIDANEVQDQDFIFQHSSLGRGYFVIRCERNKDATGVVHRFDTDPLKGDRIIKHFRSANPRPRCHNADQALPRIRKLEAIRRFGYRVVDTQGDDVSRGWVAQSNKRLIAKVKERERAKAAARRKGQAKAQQAASSKDKEKQRGPPPLYHGPARKCVSSASAVNAAELGAAGPSNGTDAGTSAGAGFHETGQGARASNSGQAHQGDGGEETDEDSIERDRVVSDIVVDPEVNQASPPRFSELWAESYQAGTRT